MVFLRKGDFFMFQKFNGVRDEDLVFMYKERKDDDVEMELIDRYKIHSKKLAYELYQKYRFTFQVEYEDIYSIVLANLFPAIKSFKSKLNFYKLWKRISSNEVNLYVSQLPLLKYKKQYDIISTSRDEPNNNLVLASDTDVNILKDDVERIILKSKVNFTEEDKDIYILLSSGYSIQDIAKETGLKYNHVRSRVNKIKEKLTSILFNQ